MPLKGNSRSGGGLSMPTIIGRQIRLLERQEATLYEQASDAYWNGPNWLCVKLEGQIEAIRKELVRLERISNDAN